MRHSREVSLAVAAAGSFSYVIIVLLEYTGVLTARQILVNVRLLCVDRQGLLAEQNGFFIVSVLKFDFCCRVVQIEVIRMTFQSCLQKCHDLEGAPTLLIEPNRDTGQIRILREII